MNTEHHHNKNVVSIEWAVIKSRKEWRVFGLFFLLSKWLSVNLWIHLTGWKKVYISANNRYQSLSSRVCERIRLNKCETNTNTNLQYTIQHEQKKMRKHSTWDGTIQWRASIFRSFILASRDLSYYSLRNTRSNNIQGHFLWVSTYQMNCARKRFSFYFNSQCEFFMIYAFCFVFFFRANILSNRWNYFFPSSIAQFRQ